MAQQKRRKLKKAFWYWLLIDLIAVFIILVLLLHRPARYRSPVITATHSNHKQVSRYLTHELLPQIYNGAQRQEPFHIIITQDDAKKIVAATEWPKQYDGIELSAPMVFFAPGKIILMSAAEVKGMDVIITVVAEPVIDQQGFLNLQVAKVKIGALNITPLARMIARRMYEQTIGFADINPDDLGVRVAASLFNNQPFDPLFQLEDKKIRLKEINIEPGKLILHLSPASD